MLSWREFNDAKLKIGKEIIRAEELTAVLQVPNDITQANVTYESAKKGLEILKKGKIHLDKMDVKKQLILKQTEANPELAPQITNESEKIHQQYQQMYDKIMKQVQLYESQTIIWKQIEDAKNALLPWLSDMNQNLTAIIQNPNEYKSGQAKFLKYSEELPQKLSLKQSIVTKVEQLEAMNSNQEIPNLRVLIKLLNDEFSDLKLTADKLQSVTQTFEEYEKDMRNEIQKTGKIVADLREAIMQCDDLSGENVAVLERLQKLQGLKGEMGNCEVMLSNIDEKVKQITAENVAFGETSIPKELSILHKRCDGVMTHANKIEGKFLYNLYIVLVLIVSFIVHYFYSA